MQREKLGAMRGGGEFNSSRLLMKQNLNVKYFVKTIFVRRSYAFCVGRGPGAGAYTGSLRPHTLVA